VDPGAKLPRISVRTRDRAIEADLSGAALSEVMRAGSRVPGALDAASEIVSSAYYGGMGEVFDAHADQVDGWEYTAIMDGGTCPECASRDGKTYESWTEAQVDMPNGGPNPRCHGRGRCRCRLVPAGAAPPAVAPSDEPPIASAPHRSFDELPSREALLRSAQEHGTVGAFGGGTGTKTSAHALTPQADGHLFDMAHDQGFTKLPHLVDDAELDDYLEAGERELWRGLEKAEQAEQFRTGEYFAGLGVHGNGTYTAYARSYQEHHLMKLRELANVDDAALLGEKEREIIAARARVIYESERRTASEIAGSYATSGGYEHEGLLRMTLRHDARVVTQVDLQDITYRELKRIEDLYEARIDDIFYRRRALENVPVTDRTAEQTAEISALADLHDEVRAEYRAAKDLLYDPGRFATSLGYDAIDVESSQYMIVLNRSAVRVSRLGRSPRSRDLEFGS
jgi:hypothetical protein